MRLNKGKMVCIQDTMEDLGVSMTFNQMNVLLGIAQLQGHTIAELSNELNLDYRQVYQIIERLGYAGGQPRNGYQIKPLKLVMKVKWGKPRSLKGGRCMYLTPKGLKFVKRVTRKKR